MDAKEAAANNIVNQLMDYVDDFYLKTDVYSGFVDFRQNNNDPMKDFVESLVEEYAKQKCKEQKEICAHEFSKDLYRPSNKLQKAILDSPLATDK